MPEDSNINLKNILKVERNERKKIVPLENDFYEKVARQIRELEDEKSKIRDLYSTKHDILEDELKTARKAIESIIYKRTTKIIKEARYSVEISSLHSPQDKEEQYLDSMTPEERDFYKSLIDLMTEYRAGLLDSIFSREVPEEIEEDLVQEEKIEKTIEPEDKKDISKEYIVVRLLKDVPTFVGIDGRNYTLSKEDVAVLSTVNAQALIKKNVAQQILIKR